MVLSLVFRTGFEWTQILPDDATLRKYCVQPESRTHDSTQAAFVQSMIVVFAGGKTGLSAAVTGT